MVEHDKNKAAYVASVLPLIEAAYDQGFANGLQAGQLIGFVEGVNALKPAISDGLRHGSSECGRAMQGLKNIGAYDDK